MHKFAKRALIFAVWCGLSGGALRAENWPGWRGPTGLGQSDEKDLPLTWGGKNQENVLWKVPVPGRGHGSPAVHGDHVYLAACDEGSGAQSVLCFDRASGKQLWETPVHASGAMRKNAKSTGRACSRTNGRPSK